jgi:outer membrane receptor protein involved in Fe transport
MNTLSLGASLQRRRIRRALSIALTLVHISLVGVAHAQTENGRIEGRLVRKDGTGVAGASVVLSETRATDLTGTHGNFSFPNLPPGTYSITLALGDNLTTTGVRVVAGETTTIEETVDWEIGFTDMLIVRGASRQLERVIDAPAAAALVGEAEIERRAAHGQLAKLLEFTPGAQVTQGGLWDFNMGTRGFNRALSRRVAVLLDGRDLSLPFFGYQGWPAFSFPLDDLASVELVRGPNAALYGANASGGVINMTSKEPRFSRGGMLRVAFGQMDTLNIETRWAGELGDGWYTRVVGGVRRSDGFAVSRVGGPEYSVACEFGLFGDCLPPEVIPLNGENTQIYFGGVRFDKYVGNGLLMTMEGGHSQGGFGVFQVIGQRAKSISEAGKRPWARFSVSEKRFNVGVAYDGYYEPVGYVGLTTGTQFSSNSYRLQAEGQTNRSFRQGSVEAAVGAMVAVEKMDSFNPAVNRQTFLFRPIASNKQAVFGQTAWKVAPRAKIFLAIRGDWSSLHDFRLSPKSSFVYSFAGDQSLRVTYNESFQVSNSLEYFLDAPVAPPVDLTALNAFCTPFGVDCRFGQTPVLALGNENLNVETVRTWEIGYKSVIAAQTFLTLDYYRGHSSDLTTSLLPQLGTPLGRLNPLFGEWNGPRGLPTAIVDQIRMLVPLLSNHVDGSNILAAASYANVGKVDSQGIELGISHQFSGGWRSTSTYSWFDFSVLRPTVGAENLLLPNAPAHTLSIGFAYERDRVDAGFDLRWVDNFRWADGFFVGEIKSYTTVDVTATYRLSDELSAGLNISNLLNDRHWETFGGALIKRRALISLQYDW